LRIAESVFRLTPRALAASVTLSFNGSKQSCFNTSPGWGRLYDVALILADAYLQAPWLHSNRQELGVSDRHAELEFRICFL
jgi:hypothetical protein